ncbi:50S ribosomal protein L11 methyltransferase [Desulfonatronospira sp.]|uniref:50S ribosomal protein L11 methyltransferase n=1 Tax=Desulfonatronospira sp. TaxID=1962951 RepID=UPI0025BD2180|nr:50S ribosomal protein L11 methyltransferase [Desulfonatronospira sp.]
MHKLQFKVKIQDRDLFEALVYEHISWGWEEEELSRESMILTIYYHQENGARQFREMALALCPGLEILEETVPPQDWNNAWKHFFTPIEVDRRFVVLPEWLQHEKRSEIPIIITPKMAFGTGHHATTHLCLQAVSRLWDKGVLRSGQNFLDLGTGSGILGIACARLGMKGLGLDIDPVAVDNALENIDTNQVQELFQARLGGLEDLSGSRKFDLILGNILSSTLNQMAPEIIRRLDDSGILILSGILTEQAPGVEKRYQELGLGRPVRLTMQEWSALVWAGAKEIHEQRNLVDELL